jgi:CubicO group peptidase (beta-lactamase class C family)
VTWPANPEGISIGWGGIEMRPHDLAKIGYLYLNGGRWAEEQVVPADWARASTRKHIDGTLQEGYGYGWWLAGDLYMALGYAGQYLIVDPDRNLVVVFASDLAERDFYLPQELFDDHIVPAARSRRPLPENPEGVARLQVSTAAFARP